MNCISRTCFIVAIVLGAAISAHAESATNHPLIHWPVRPTWKRLYSDRVTILNPAYPLRPTARWDVLILYADGSLHALNPSNGRIVWPKPIPCRRQPTLLGMDSQSCYFATPHRLFALSRIDGRQQWQYGEPPDDDPRADPEWSVAWTHTAMTHRHVFAASDRGELACLDLEDGTLRWHRETGARIDALVASDRRAYYGQRAGSQYRIITLDTSTGHPLHTLRCEERASNPLLVLADDGSLIAIRSTRILSIQSGASAVRWRLNTPGRFVPSTLSLSPDRLMISDDGRRIDGYDPRNGKRSWRSPSIGTDTREGLWTALAGGRLIAASGDALVDIDTFDGHIVWKAHRPPGIRLQSPLITADSIVMLSEARRRPRPIAPMDHAPSDGTRRYRIRCFELDGGKEMRVSENGALITEPIESYGGLFARDGALILLDGDQLIGYGEGKNSE
ncbi:MAG: PQQ-binding-like beta-propeller repeat protein [Phycisphaerae bacterium]